MQKKFTKMGMWLAIIFSQVCVQGFGFSDNTEALKGPQLKELTFLVSPGDLSFDQDNISVIVDGISYAVHSLKRIGDQWVAKAGVRYCPQGHPTCRNCDLCHLEGCRYYVRPCGLWK